MTTELLTSIEQVIKLNKWDKYSYAYALDHMRMHMNYSGSMSIYKKQDLVDMFFAEIKKPGQFDKIKSFTCFKSL